MKSRVVTLIDNRALEGFESEHGLAIYVEACDKKILFDTGQSGKFIENAERLGIGLNELDYVVLSHGHYDHSGGVKNLVEYLGEKCELIVGEDFETIKSRTGENIYGVLGGTHLVNAEDEWIEEVVSYLENSDIEIVATSHCTGERAERELKKRLVNRFRENYVGDELNI